MKTKIKAGVLLVLISCVGILFLIVQNNIEHNDTIRNVRSDEVAPRNEDAEVNTSEEVNEERYLGKDLSSEDTAKIADKSDIISRLKLLGSKHQVKYKMISKKFKWTLFNTFVRDVIF